MDAPIDTTITEEVAAAGCADRAAVALGLAATALATSSRPTGAASGRLWIFLIIFFFSLFAEFIANDKPILVKYDGHYYCADLQVLPGDRRSAASSRPRLIIATPR